MQRCLQLAQLGAGSVAPNPMVGSVLVHDGRIIGEGYHQQYGGPHAEVNCVNSVSVEDRSLIPYSTIYVSLEPCAHFGKTPPCADLIIRNRIPKVVIGCRDPFKEVDGKGIEKLQQAGIETIVGILEKECLVLNRRFFTFHTKFRPFVVLKWAETADGKIATTDDSRTFISNGYSNRLVHHWRSEEAAIMVGTNTATLDNPSLTTRLWKGKNPVRVVMDMQLRLPASLQVFDGSVPTLIFNGIKAQTADNVQFIKIDLQAEPLQQILQQLYKDNIQSVLVEGGAQLLQSFIDFNLYDEIRVIQNKALYIGDGLRAPSLAHVQLKKQYHLLDDEISIYHPA